MFATDFYEEMIISGDKGRLIANESFKFNQLPKSKATLSRECGEGNLSAEMELKYSEEIEKTNATRLSDIINDELGLITVSDFGGAEGIQMQGLDSEYTLILIDNQPLVGRLAGTLDLNRISVGNVKQIEIVRGPSSSLYGNNAFAGVVNIITEEPKPGFKAEVIGSYETHNTFDKNANISYRKNNFYSSIFFNNFSSNGYDLVEGDGLNTVNKFRNNTLQIKLRKDICLLYTSPSPRDS